MKALLVLILLFLMVVGFNALFSQMAPHGAAWNWLRIAGTLFVSYLVLALVIRK